MQPLTIIIIIIISINNKIMNTEIGLNLHKIKTVKVHLIIKKELSGMNNFLWQEP
jgi:hypothetical protein